MNKYYEACKNDYFDYNGVRYYAGTKFTTNHDYHIDVPAYFRGWKPNDPNVYEITMTIGPKKCQTTIWVPKEEMAARINEIVDGNHYVEMESRIGYCKDSDIPELFFGWIAYIAIMLVLCIFRERVGAWILVSCYFFYWRHKIKEDNMYFKGD